MLTSLQCSCHKDRHHLLERARQASRRSQRLAPPPMTSPTRGTGPTSPIGNQVPRPTDDLILGVNGGGNPEPIRMHSTTPTDDIDLSAIIPQQPLGHYNPTLYGPFAPQVPRYNGQNIGLSPVGTNRSWLSPLQGISRNVGNAAPSFDEQYIAIGRELIGLSGTWECQSGSSETQSTASLSSGSSGGCRTRFPSLHEMVSHYRRRHSPFRAANRPFLFKCINCEVLNDNQTSPCLSCRNPQRRFEKWYYGHVPAIQASQSQFSLPVANQDPFNFNHPSGQSGPWTGQNLNHSNGNMFLFGGANGGNSGGGFKWFANVCQGDEWSDDRCEEKSRGLFDQTSAHGSSTPRQACCNQRSSFSQALAVDSLPALACIATLLLLPPLTLLSVPIIEGCVTTGCMAFSISRITARLVNVVRDHMLGSSVLCIVAGLVVTWLFLHIRFQLDQHQGSDVS